MNTLVLVLLLALTAAISWWNARVCGSYWSESKSLGGFTRVLMWCGAIQSAVGFSMLLLVIEVFAAASLGYLSPEAIKAITSLWYLAVVIPCIGTGTIIMVYSWSVAWRTKSWGDAGIAAWNTYANLSNIADAFSAVPEAFKSVRDLFEDADDKSMPVMLIIALVAISLIGGAVLTAWLIAVYDKRARLSVAGQAMPA